jgi:cation diffusion facilitator family transporter
MKPEGRARENAIAIGVGLAANASLAVVKTAVGILGHSPALLAEGINSTSDVAYLIVVAVFVHLARKPADEEHPYGHRQLETIAAVVVGAFVVTTAVAVFWDAVNEVYDLLSGGGDFEGAAGIALWVALATVALKVALTAMTYKTARRTGNAAVLALAHDHRNDVLSASAASVGIFLGRMGYPWVDPLAGALVAMVILRVGIKILSEATADLMDTVPGRALAEQIGGILAEVPGVEQVEEIHAHRFGPYLVVNLTIGVSGAQSVASGDTIASQAEAALHREIPLLRRVHVHYHPSRRRKGGASPA